MNFIVDYNRPQGAFSQNLDHRFEQYSLHFLKLFFFFSFKLFQPYHAILTIVLFLNLNLSPLVWFGSTFMFLYLIIAVITWKWTQTTLVPKPHLKLSIFAILVYFSKCNKKLTSWVGFLFRLASSEKWNKNPTPLGLFTRIPCTSCYFFNKKKES